MLLVNTACRVSSTFTQHVASHKRSHSMSRLIRVHGGLELKKEKDDVVVLPEISFEKAAELKEVISHSFLINNKQQVLS